MKYPPLLTLQNLALVLLTTASLYLMTHMRGLSSTIAQLPSSDQIVNLQEQLDRLEGEKDSSQRLVFVTPEEFQNSERRTTARLDALDQSVLPIDSINHLQRELTLLSEEVKSTQKQLVSLHSTIASQSPPRRKPSEFPRAFKPTTPTQTLKPTPLPFNILGIDSRGGETFLAIAAPDASHLSDVVLLRPTNTYMGWRLSSLLLDQAHFIRPDGSFLIATIR